MSEKTVRIVGGFGLGVLLLFNLLGAAFLAFEVYASHRAPAIILRDTQGLQQAFDAYKDRADNAQKLVTVLIGLSSLYALALAFTTFLSAQQYLQTLKANTDLSNEAIRNARDAATNLVAKTTADLELALKPVDATITQVKQLSEEAVKTLDAANKSNQEAKEQAERLRNEFPTFDRMAEAIDIMIGRLRQLLPDTEVIDEHYRQMTPQQHQEVLLYEKGVAVFEVLNPVMDEKTLEVYLRLCKYYRAKFVAERTVSTVGLPQESIERSKFYLSKYARPGENFVALTERGIIAFKQGAASDLRLARALFELSIDREYAQQRAYYWLSVVQHGFEEYELADQTLSTALLQANWERQLSSPNQHHDLLYNRACARSRLALKAADPAQKDSYAQNAIRDLDDACPAPDETALSIFDDDTKPAKDLAYLLGAFPHRMEAIRKRLNGA